MSAPHLPNLELVLDSLNRQFGWDDPAASFSVVSTRQGRHSTISLLSSDRGDDVVVKDGRDHWESHTARQVAKAMAGAASALDAAGHVSLRAPEPVAWSESPKLTVSRYIDGTDLVDLMYNAEHPLWEDESGTAETWLRKSGMALAAYHRHAAADATTYPAAVRSMQSTTRKLLIRPRIAHRLTPDIGEHLHARSYVDPNPSNWRCAADGTVWLLDAPLQTRYAFVHRDIARFLARAERVLRAHDQEWRFPVVRDAFVAGYESYGSPLHDPRDQTLLAVFRAGYHLALARAPFRRGWHRTRVHLAKAVSIRRQVLRAGRRSNSREDHRPSSTPRLR